MTILLASIMLTLSPVFHVGELAEYYISQEGNKITMKVVLEKDEILILRFSCLVVGLGYIFKSIPYIASAILIVDDVAQSATEDEEGQLGPILKVLSMNLPFKHLGI